MTFKKEKTDVPGNIHGVSLNKEIGKGAQATKCFPFCLMFSQKNQNYFNDKHKRIPHESIFPKQKENDLKRSFLIERK